VETYAQLRDRMIAKYGRGDFGKLNVDQAMQVIENINQDIDNKEMAFVISPPNSLGYSDQSCLFLCNRKIRTGRDR
jgi:thymidylate synthase